VKKEICDFCAEKSTKIFESNGFFFLSFFRGKFSLSLFSSVRGKKQPINFSLFCLFSSATIYTHTRCAAFQQNTNTVRFLRAREREIRRKMSRML
jgi:hypothetical protein